MAVALRPPASADYPRWHRDQRRDLRPLGVRHAGRIHPPAQWAIRGVAVAMRQTIARHGAPRTIDTVDRVQQGQQGLLRCCGLNTHQLHKRPCLYAFPDNNSPNETRSHPMSG